MTAPEPGGPDIAAAKDDLSETEMAFRAKMLAETQRADAAEKELEWVRAVNDALGDWLTTYRANAKQARTTALEECRRLCVLRMTAWTLADDQQPQAFRDGIEKACSDLAIRIAALTATAPKEGT